MELIASYTATGSVSNIEFTSIAADWTDLCVKISARTDRVNTTDQLKISFNGVATSYTGIILYGTGSSALSETNAAATGGSTYLIGEYINAANGTASTFSNSEFYIPNYAGSTYKSLSMDLAQENNTTAANLSMTAGLWSNTAAITSIKLQSANGFNFVIHSTAYLYGVKNA